MNEEEIYQARLALIRAKKAQSRNLGLFCATGGAIAFTYAGFSGAAAAFLIYLGAKNMIEKPIATAVHGDDGAMSAAAKKHLPNDERRIIEGQPIRAPHSQTSTTLEKPHHEPPRSVGGDSQPPRQLPIRNAPRIATVARPSTGAGESVGSEERDPVPAVGGGDPVEIVAAQPDIEPRTERVAGLQYRLGGFAPMPEPSPDQWFEDLFSEPWHCFVYGSTGDGKSTFVCNILHRLKSLIPDAEVMIIDPKYPYSEWGGFPVAFKGDRELLRGVEAMGKETARRLEYATNEVEAGRSRPEFPPIIYVLDEANTAFTDYGPTVGDNVKRIVSRGRALNVWGVFIGTSCNVSAYGLQVPDLYNCHRFALKSLAAVAIKRDDTLTPTEVNRLINDLKVSRSSRYIALLQTEGRDREIVTLPPPHHAPTPTPPPVATEAPATPDRPTGTSGDDAQDVAPVDDGDRPVQPRDGVRVGLLGDVSDESLRGEFIRGKSYKDVLRGFGIPPGSPEALRVAQVNAAVDGEIRAVSRTHSQNATAEAFGASKGSGAAYQHICKVWREENPSPPPVFSGMV